MIKRISKIALLSAMAFYCLLAVIGNISDYHANFPAVVRVLQMQDIFPNSSIAYRAIKSPELHTCAFVCIIFFEGLSALLCAFGAFQLLRVVKGSSEAFNRAKGWGIAGLTVGFLTWQVLFMSIAGEWFGMWMSPMLNPAITTAFQIFITMLVVLIYLTHKDD